jgi:AraC-like DNA-binding protein
MHYALELGVLLSGRIRRLSEGYARVIEPGDVWFQGGWEPHAYELLSLPATALSFGVAPHALVAEALEEQAQYDWLAPFLVPPEARPRPPAHRRKDFLALAATMVARQGDRPVEARLWRRLILLEIMLLAREYWTPPTKASAPPPDAYSRMSRAVGLVLSTPRPVRLSEAAKACDMSRNAFSRLFKATLGISFAKYCLRHRLSAGVEQLLRTDDAVKAVAADWGFVNPSHFDRCFRRYYGCSPLQYRLRAHLAASSPAPK